VNRSIIARVLGIGAVVLGLTLSTMAGSASAQSRDSVQPDSQIRTVDLADTVQRLASAVPPDWKTTAGAQAATDWQGAPSAGVDTLQTERCGYWAQYDSYYTHCGHNSIVIHVDFAFASDRAITVWPGRTNCPSIHTCATAAGGSTTPIASSTAASPRYPPRSRTLALSRWPSLTCGRSTETPKWHTESYLRKIGAWNFSILVWTTKVASARTLGAGRERARRVRPASNRIVDGARCGICWPVRFHRDWRRSQ
jgi:hypothetical protein